MAEKRATAGKGEPSATPETVSKVEWVDGPEGPSRHYVNMAQIRTSVTDVTIELGQVSDGDSRPIKATHTLQLLMSPQHAKALAGLLVNHILLYESTFGKIPEAPQTADHETITEAIQRIVSERGPDGS